METKILLDYEEYQLLLDYKDKYEKLKSEKDSKDSDMPRLKDPRLINEGEESNQISQAGKGCDGEFGDSLTEREFEILIKKFIEKYQQPKEESIGESSSEKKLKSVNVISDQPLSLLGKRYHKKGRIFLESIFSSPNISIKENGEVSFYGEIIPKSNIARFLKYAMTGSPSKTLVGKKEFDEFLMKENLKVDKIVRTRISAKRKKEKKNEVQEASKGETMDINEEIQKVQDDSKWYCLMLPNVWK